jgi:hypothetical protein
MKTAAFMAGVAALRALLFGKELGDDVHFAYRFGNDGTFTGTEIGKDVRRKWRVAADEICWKPAKQSMPR